MFVIETCNLIKNFGKTKALNGVNLQVEEGSIHAFLGPNGAGKTTTIRILLGLLNPTSGTASLFGKNVSKEGEKGRRYISYVPGEVNLWPNFSGGEVINLLLTLGQKKINQQRLNYYIELFELDPSKKCKTYSKGNRQKVALISALASDAHLFILDEPTTGLDPLMEQKFQQEIKALQQEGKTIFLSSHLLGEVKKLATVVSIIRQGEISVTTTMDDLNRKNVNGLEEFFLSEYKEKKV